MANGGINNFCQSRVGIPNMEMEALPLLKRTSSLLATLAVHFSPSLAAVSPFNVATDVIFFVQTERYNILDIGVLFMC